MRKEQEKVEETEEVKKGEKPFTTKPPQRMTKSTIKRVLNEQAGRLEADLDALGEKMEGSGWVVKRYLKLAIDMFEIKVARGSSYIPTPARYANSRCGLINIQNKDQECFKWCMRYHQTQKEKHDARISVLSKMKDKYDYTGVEFPRAMTILTDSRN